MYGTHTTDYAHFQQITEAMEDLLTVAQSKRLLKAVEMGGYDAGALALARISRQIAAEKFQIMQAAAFQQGQLMSLQQTAEPDAAPAAAVSSVPLSPRLVPRVAVDSDAIVSVGFQRVAGSLGDLVVEWVGGAVYVYEDVPEWMHGELMRSASKGGYMNRKIKPIYDALLLVD